MRDTWTFEKTKRLCKFYFPPCLGNVGWCYWAWSCLSWTTTSTCTRRPVFILFISLVGFKTFASDILFSLITLLMEKTLKQNKYFLLLSNKRLKTERGELIKPFRNGSRLCSRMSGRLVFSDFPPGSRPGQCVMLKSSIRLCWNSPRSYTTNFHVTYRKTGDCGPPLIL